MTDLVQRLRTPWVDPAATPLEFAEAADAIEKLTAERDMLVDALREADRIASKYADESYAWVQQALATVEKTK